MGGSYPLDALVVVMLVSLLFGCEKMKKNRRRVSGGFQVLGCVLNDDHPCAGIQREFKMAKVKTCALHGLDGSTLAQRKTDWLHKADQSV